MRRVRVSGFTAISFKDFRIITGKEFESVFSDEFNLTKIQNLRKVINHLHF